MRELGHPRGEYAKTAERRRDIVLAGIEVFSTSGFRSGSIREIAERVNLSQAGILHHFGNKAQLLAAVLQARDDLDFKRMSLGDASGLRTITSIVALAAHNQTVPGLVQLHCVLSAEATAPDHPAHAYFVRRYKEVVELCTVAFKEIQEAGQLREGVDPAWAARTLTALLDGLQVQWLLDPTNLNMAEETRAFLSTLLKPEVSL